MKYSNGLLFISNMGNEYQLLNTSNMVYIKVLSFNLNPVIGLGPHSMLDVCVGPKNTYKSHPIRIRNNYHSAYKIWDFSVCNPSNASLMVSFEVPRAFHKSREVASAKVCLRDFEPNTITSKQVQLYSENGIPVGSCIITVHLSCDGTKQFQAH